MYRYRYRYRYREREAMTVSTVSRVKSNQLTNHNQHISSHIQYSIMDSWGYCTIVEDRDINLGIPFHFDECN